VAGAIYLVVAAVRWSVGDDRAALAVTLVLPVALMAVTFGRRGGVAGGAAAVALYGVWSAAWRTSVGLAGWTTVAGVLLFGYLLGEAVDDLEASEQRARAAEEAGRWAEQLARRHHDAIEINDTLVQGVAAAKWALEAGNAEWALEVMQATVIEGEGLVSQLLRSSGPAPVACGPSGT
jgi:hypothetical protein